VVEMDKCISSMKVSHCLAERRYSRIRAREKPVTTVTHSAVVTETMKVIQCRTFCDDAKMKMKYLTLC